MDIKKETIVKLVAWSEGRWGNWVRYVIGALIGALVAAGLLTVSGCAGWARVSLASDQGVVMYQRDEAGRLVVRVEPGEGGVVVEQRKGGK